MAHPEDESPLLNFAAINADGTNRNKSINTPDKLAAHLYEVNAQYFDDSFFTCYSEISSMAVVNRLCDYPGRHSTYFKVGKQEYMVALWPDDCEVVTDYTGKQLIQASAVGKYISITLHTNGCQIQVVCAHLPRKSGKARAWSLVSNVLEEGLESADLVCLVGDLNERESYIRDQLDSLAPVETAFDDDTATTQAGSSIDNVVLLHDTLTFSDATAHSNHKMFSHYPIDASVPLDDII